MTDIDATKTSESLFEYDYTIICKNGFYLKDNITDDQYAKWFNSKAINVFNKAHCGNGGTTGFINYALTHNKGILILVPNVSICKSKEEEYKDNGDVCCIYGGSGRIVGDAKVIIATYDQFHKLMKGGMAECGVVFGDDWSSLVWSGRTILVDEYHKIVDECSFRDVCFDVTKLIKEQNNGVILMSATPHWGYVGFLKEYMADRDIKTYNVEYDDETSLLIEKGTPRLIQIYDVRKKIADIISKMYRSDRNRQIVVFYNNRSAIKKMMGKMGVKDVEVLCSQEHADDFGEYYSGVFNMDKKLHFMTSAYFTGCDINVHVDACVIIGSKCQSFLSYSSKEIKQMIGRFRQGCSGVHLFYNGNVQDFYDFDTNVTNYKECMNYLEDAGENWVNEEDAVKQKQRSLMLKDNIEDTKCWTSIDSVKKMLEKTGYIVKKKEIGEFDKLIMPKKLSAKDTKKKIINGDVVSWDENNMVGQYKAYFKEFGEKALMDASQMDVKNWYKIRKDVEVDTDKLSVMLPKELFDAVGLEDGYYSHSMLVAYLKYVGVDYTVDEMPMKFSETFGCYALPINVKSKNHDREKYLVVRADTLISMNHKLMKFSISSAKWEKFDEESLISESSSKIPISPKKSMIDLFKEHIFVSLNHKMTSNKHLLSKTFNLDTMTFQNLTGIKMYDWVAGDKEHRLPEVKKDDILLKQWNEIKNYSQSKISEMFKITYSEYPHTISEMTNINSLIIDIDNGLSFSEFKKRYRKYKWTAYPTLNNINEDWNKFRVIVPLSRLLELSGPNNLKVLKLLRVMFCPFEDPNHQMASYINQCDWDNRYENEGEKYTIDQELVDNLTLRLQSFSEYKTTLFTKGSKMDTKAISLSSMSLEDAKEYFERSFGSADGARHKALFIIKNRLSATDSALFEDWLAGKYPTYMTKWKGHKVILK